MKERSYPKCLTNGVHRDADAASECPLIPGRSKRQKLDNWKAAQPAVVIRPHNREE